MIGSTDYVYRTCRQGEGGSWACTVHLYNNGEMAWGPVDISSGSASVAVEGTSTYADREGPEFECKDFEGEKPEDLAGAVATITISGEELTGGIGLEGVDVFDIAASLS